MRPTNLHSISINLIGFLFVEVALNTNFLYLDLVEVTTPLPAKAVGFLSNIDTKKTISKKTNKSEPNLILEKFILSLDYVSTNPNP